MEDVEDGMEVLQVFGPGGTDMSSKNTRTHLRRNWRSMAFIRLWNVAGASVRLNGITRNSKCL
jgi:hypothetical protein